MKILPCRDILEEYPVVAWDHFMSSLKSWGHAPSIEYVQSMITNHLSHLVALWGFPDIRLSGIRQSDFCLSTYAYHTFAYQGLCLSEAEFEIRTIAHQGGTSAYQKLKYFCEYFCLCLYCLHIAKSEWRNKERETLWKRSKPYRFATKEFLESCSASNLPKVTLRQAFFPDTSLEEAMARTSGQLNF